MRILAALFFVVVAGLPSTIRAQDTPDPPTGVREFTTSGTWRVPSNVSRITVELWGGGGGGAGGASGLAGSGGPGGGGGAGGSGAYVRANVPVKPGEIYSITVGAPGTGGRGESRDGAQPGGDGGDTTLSLDRTVLLVARGGMGGGAPKRAHHRGGVAGSGGTAKVNRSTLVREGNSGTSGHDGGFSEWTSTSGGRGGHAVLGTVRPPASFGGDGGDGMGFGYAEDGRAGGAGSAIITW